MHTLPNLPPAIAREIFAQLCSALPPPVVNTAEGIESRNNLAMAELAAMLPADAVEAMLALDAVLAGAHADDCLRLVTEHHDDFANAARCRSQYFAMSRAARRAHHVLLDMQKARLSAAVLLALPMPPPARHAAPPAAPARHNAPPILVPTPRKPASAPLPADLALADEYAQEHCDIAYDIRAAGGLTPEIGWLPKAMLPIDLAIVDALVNGDSPILRTLDELGAATAVAA